MADFISREAGRMAELKPCQFCGNKDVKVGGWPVEYVSCKCGAEGPKNSSKAVDTSRMEQEVYG